MTAPNYSYFDDPFLIPTNSSMKISFSLAKESGIQAARMIRNKHPNIFDNQIISEPQFPMLGVKEVFIDDNSVVTVNTLEILIKNKEVKDSVLVYNKLLKEEVPVDEKLKQKLLELVSFYNNTDQVDEDLIEGIYVYNNEPKYDTVLEKHLLSAKNYWDDNGFAEHLYNSLKEKGSNARSTIIQGMIRHSQIDKAFLQFHEADENKVILSVGAYNAILSCAHLKMIEFPEVKKFILDIFEKMKKNKVAPNISSLNSALESLKKTAPPQIDEAQNFSLQLVSEFKSIGIMPSLGTYSLLINIFYKQKQVNKDILVPILNQIELGELKLQCVIDVNFFFTAMAVCNFFYNDANLAHRIHKLLLQKNNLKFLGSKQRADDYYEKYLNVILYNEPIEVFLKFWNEIVPNTYSPNWNLVNKVLNIALDRNGALYLLPQIWSDVLLMQFMGSGKVTIINKIIPVFMQKMIENIPGEMNLNLVHSYNDVLSSMCEILIKFSSEEQNNKRQLVDQHINYTIHYFNLMHIGLKNNNFKVCTRVLNFLLSEENWESSPGDKADLVYELFVIECVKHNDLNNAMNLLKYSAKTYSNQKLFIAEQIKNNFSDLNYNQKETINSALYG